MLPRNSAGLETFQPIVAVLAYRQGFYSTPSSCDLRTLYTIPCSGCKNMRKYCHDGFAPGKTWPLDTRLLLPVCMILLR